jgi:hypothetical protein
MTDLTSAQLTNLAAILLGEAPGRAANKDKALRRLIATADGYGLRGIKKIAALPSAEALARVVAHAAEATTKPRLRKPVKVEPAPPVAAPPAHATDDKPWFRSGDAAEARMLAVMIEVGPAKLAAFRAKFAEGQEQAAEFDALSQTQQNGILIRAMDRLMAAGKLTRNGLFYGVKEDIANAKAA